MRNDGEIVRMLRRRSMELVDSNESIVFKQQVHHVHGLVSFLSWSFLVG